MIKAAIGVLAHGTARHRASRVRWRGERVDVLK
jgi:hypothetical protein